MKMRPKEKPGKEYVHYHKDGSVWAKGRMNGETPDGYWEWFRKDGTILRSGYFEKGTQTGEWTTYDKAGKVYKVTRMKPKPVRDGGGAPALKGKRPKA